MTPRPLARRAFLGGVGAGLALARTELEAPAREAEEAIARLTEDVRANGFDGLRTAYDLDPDVTYLNHASIGTVPRVVRETQARLLETCESNPWLHVWGHAWDDAWERTRARAADFVGGAPDELALTRTTTEGFNILAQGLPLEAGDEVVFSSLNHTGASACWEAQARRRGFSVRRFAFPVGDAPGLSADDLVELHTRELRDETRVLVLPHVDNVLGVRHPVEAIAAAARERGVRWVAVDGAQTIGMLRIDVRALGVDFYATSAHKWLQAPKGSGLAWIAPRLLEVLEPMQVTWGQARWRGTARAFEDWGTRDLARILALEPAVELQDALGAERKEEHFARLFAHARDRCGSEAPLTWRSPRQWELGASLYAVEVARPSGEVFEDALRAGIVLRPFATDELNTVRISPSAANTTSEIDRLFELLQA